MSTVWMRREREKNGRERGSKKTEMKEREMEIKKSGYVLLHYIWYDMQNLPSCLKLQFYQWKICMAAFFLRPICLEITSWFYYTLVHYKESGQLAIFCA